MTLWSIHLRRIGPLVSIAGAGVLCGAAPAPEGTEVTGALAGGRYTRSGCGGYRYNIAEGSVYGQVRGRVGDHMTWSAESAAGAGVVTSVSQTLGEDDDPDQEQEFRAGDFAPVTFHAARLGVDLRYGGVSLGPGLLITDELASAQLVPSVSGWAGRRELLYGWGGYFSGPLTGATLPNYIQLGLGRAGPQWELEVGSNVALGLSATGRVRLRERLWLGSDLYVDLPGGRSTRDGARIMGQITYRAPR